MKFTPMAIQAQLLEEQSQWIMSILDIVRHYCIFLALENFFRKFAGCGSNRRGLALPMRVENLIDGRMEKESV